VLGREGRPEGMEGFAVHRGEGPRTSANPSGGALTRYISITIPVEIEVRASVNRPHLLVFGLERPRDPCAGCTLSSYGCGERADGRRESRRERGAPDTGFR
jgi:hypothetical protein